jgi:transcriptional regulator with XRE-family HTH domain
MNNRLRLWRQKARLSQADAGEALGLSRATYAAVESGRLIPTDRVAEILRAAFNESPDRLLHPVEAGRLPKLREAVR